MHVSIAFSVFLALGCYGADTETVDSSQLENVHGAYEVNFQAQSICYTYMSTALINGYPSGPTLAPFPSVNLGGVSEPDSPILKETIIPVSETLTTPSPYPTPTSSQGDASRPYPAIIPGPIIPSPEPEPPLGYPTIAQIYSDTTTSTTTVPPSGTVIGTITDIPARTASIPLPTLDCNPFGYLIQDTSLYRVNITTGASELIKQVVGDGSNINAMGYNVADNFLYAAIGGAPGNLIRISATGDSVILGSLDLGTPVYAGDVDENSQFWINSAGRPWAQIDLRPGSPMFGATVARGVASLPGQTVIDWAYVPGGGDALYGLGHDAFYSRTTLMRFDRTTHTWTALTDFGDIAGRNAWGAVYASDDGYLYGSEDTSGQIWRFPLPARGKRAVRISHGPASASNDGARCIRSENL
ncbi:hypothetical protein F4809DRAFT_655707 [Biscogniauxia mediterranea]|nr:hypothetical protein F4809DRAFT_655707 [Biscogniauxia mediterranea]